MFIAKGLSNFIESGKTEKVWKLIRIEKEILNF